jgi:multiple antibiotic resistance protein
MNELADWQEYVRLFGGLIAMLNIAGNVPVFLTLTGHLDRSEKRKCALAATMTALCILSVSALFGDVVLDFFGISISNVRIAGGLILIGFGLRMVGVFGPEKPQQDAGAGSAISIGVSPLGMPLLAGPGAISTAIIYAQLHETYLHGVVVLLIVFAACALLYATFQFAILAGSRVNPTAAILINRTMGLIVVSIAVALVSDGIRAEFLAG